jgi:hypothetical protein
VFQRVDSLFGIESQIVKEEWSIPPPIVSSNVRNNSATKSDGSNHVSSHGLTKQMAEELSKKLTGKENIIMWTF